MTPDPSKGFDPKNPSSWNRYAYVNDDPVNFTDRSGLFAESAEFGELISPKFLPANPDPEPLPDPGPPPPKPPKPMGYPGAWADLRKPDCYRMFGFVSAADAQHDFANENFQIVHLGQLQVQPDANGNLDPVNDTQPPAQNPHGTDTIQINYDYSWADFSRVLAMNVATGQQTIYDYTGLISQGISRNMSSIQLSWLILLHEFGHTPSGGNRPDDSLFDVRKYDQDIYDKCIK